MIWKELKVIATGSFKFSSSTFHDEEEYLFPLLVEDHKLVKKHFPSIVD